MLRVPIGHPFKGGLGVLFRLGLSRGRELLGPSWGLGLISAAQVALNPERACRASAEIFTLDERAPKRDGSCSPPVKQATYPAPTS
jgi:hypothetical protein